jgi:hypothetical protein
VMGMARTPGAGARTLELSVSAKRCANKSSGILWNDLNSGPTRPNAGDLVDYQPA